MSFAPMKPLRGPRPVFARPSCDEDECCEPHPGWEIAKAVLGGLALGAAPTLANVLVHKLWPELVEDEERFELVCDEEDEDDE